MKTFSDTVPQRRRREKALDRLFKEIELLKKVISSESHIFSFDEKTKTIKKRLSRLEQRKDNLWLKLKSMYPATKRYVEAKDEYQDLFLRIKELSNALNKESMSDKDKATAKYLEFQKQKLARKFGEAKTLCIRLNKPLPNF